ncbi:hypothetical protein AXE80_10125 [Wenyingzhuangia fucanilytica]|uniref:PKD domain-containing protein n=1 Tax=Wenyingzhuangia fucanilytica TaxID=1790137 RepID=A0A1B1Y767_9FLAO|nr:PKD domain-containing protein [Wenyingzhuangia fucanilytica]ANW96610.1 hypothetical protein AXE80_10125 [Wenyingzhuangia fucanilytica]
MKKYSLIILLSLMALVGCNVDDYTEPANFSAPLVFTPSIFNINESSIANNIPISIDDFSSLSDISQGVVSRTWVIEDGANFLNSEFTRKDSVNLDRFIDNKLGTSSQTKLVHVLFQKAGETTVTLKNKFEKEVSFLGNDAVQGEDGLWELSTVFKYDVYQRLNAEASVKNEEDGTEVFLTQSQHPSTDDTSNFTTITIEAGSNLTFKDLTTVGRPSDRVWDFDGGQPETSTEEEQVVTYNRIGEYTTNLTVSRAKLGNNTLRYSEQTKAIPVIIKVIPSTKPFTINGNAFAVNDGSSAPGTKQIAFRVNGILEPFTGVENDFSVNVVNGTFNQNFNVVSAQVSSTDETLIELELSEAVLNSDTIKLSYNGTGITAIDARVLNAFTDETVEPLIINYLTSNVNPGFENPATNDLWANADGYRLFIPAGNNASGNNQIANATNPGGGLYLSRSTDRASEGSASMKFDAVLPFESGISFLGLSNVLFQNAEIPAGVYSFKFDLYYEPGTTMGGVFTRIFGSTPDIETMSFNAPGTGQWFTVEREINVGAGGITGNAVFNFRNGGPGNENDGVTGRQTFYIDNFQVVAKENR